jgi:hypothetical protein
MCLSQELDIQVIGKVTVFFLPGLSISPVTVGLPVLHMLNAHAVKSQ